MYNHALLCSANSRRSFCLSIFSEDLTSNDLDRTIFFKSPSCIFNSLLHTIHINFRVWHWRHFKCYVLICFKLICCINCKRSEILLYSGTISCTSFLRSNGKAPTTIGFGFPACFALLNVACTSSGKFSISRCFTVVNSPSANIVRVGEAKE